MGNKLSLEDINFEVRNELVQAVDFRDYDNLLQASRNLKRALEVTTYGRRYTALFEAEGDRMCRIRDHYAQNFRHISMTITMEQVIDELMKPKCECGNWAFLIHAFSFPPRRICYWTENRPMTTKCFPPLVLRKLPELSQLYQLDINAVDQLPFVRPMPRPDTTACLDLKTLEELARRTHGDKFARSITAIVLEDNTFFLRSISSGAGPGWELRYHVPIQLGVFHSIPSSMDFRPFPPLVCEHCHYPVESNERYQYLPFDIQYLRDHIEITHNHMLQDFDAGWAAFPERIRDIWCKSARNWPLARYHHPKWNSWGETTRTIWSALIDDRECKARIARTELKFAIGQRNIYPLPDVRHVIAPERIGRPDWCDLPLLMHAWFVMKEEQAMIEFLSRAADDKERQKLGEEVIAAFEPFNEVYRKFPPFGLDFFPITEAITPI